MEDETKKGAPKKLETDALYRLRLLAVLRMLQLWTGPKPLFTHHQLARLCNVSEKTFRNDLATLREIEDARLKKGNRVPPKSDKGGTEQVEPPVGGAGAMLPERKRAVAIGDHTSGEFTRYDRFGRAVK